MIQRLGSVRLTFYTLGALILLMGAGVFLAPSFSASFLLLNHADVLDWLMNAETVSLLIKAWFLTLCLVSALLLVNALCCCLGRQFTQARKTGSSRNWFFFILHCLFILVLASHGLILATGSKSHGVMLFPGQSADFKTHRIFLDQVAFKDDAALLNVPKNQQRTLMTMENIRLGNNTAQIRLEREGRHLKTQQVKMLSPLRHGFLQITLKEFVNKNGRIGVNLILTRNGMTPFFFLVYLVMIITLAGYTLVTWKKHPAQEKSHELSVLSGPCASHGRPAP